MKSTEELWTAILDGDLGAWRELVERYARLVHAVAIRAGISEFDADDCSQHAWMALYKHRKTIRDPVTIPAWLMRTTRRQAIQMIQRQARTREIDSNAPPIEQTLLPDDEMALLEQQTAVEFALAKLNPRCRKLLSLLFLESKSKSYREVAAALDVAPNTLGPLRSRCLNRLKKILREMGFDAN
jgi:RNA polymerase sigma factor (sigma-70 family)